MYYFDYFENIKSAVIRPNVGQHIIIYIDSMFLLGVRYKYSL